MDPPIPFEEALNRLISGAKTLSVQSHPAMNSTGRYSAESVAAKLNHPPFDNSQVDGYALAFNGEILEFNLVGKVFAGKSLSGRLKPGKAARIFTGAPIPHGADAVVMQEFATLENEVVRIGSIPKSGDFIRRLGEDFKVGDEILAEGTRVGPTQLGLLSLAGITSLLIRRQPQITILVTGSEIVRPGEMPKEGQLPDAVGPMLLNLLIQMNLSSDVHYIHDDEQDLRLQLNGMVKNDLVIISGGASVGEKDLVRQMLLDLGFTSIFWGVAMRPGMPTGVYQHNTGAIAISLAGNPVSAFVGFSMFIKPLIKFWAGLSPRIPFERAICGSDLTKQPGYAQFYRAKRNVDGEVFPFQFQGSHRMKDLANANCLLYFPRESAEIKAGQQVEVLAIN